MGRGERLVLKPLVHIETPICLAQEKKQSKTQGFNELVQGVLTFSIRDAYSDMPDEPAEGEGSGGQVSSQNAIGTCGHTAVPVRGCDEE